ncbi:hypothetical protein PCK2_000576, partial [Pneumocystis canis]
MLKKEDFYKLEWTLIKGKDVHLNNDWKFLIELVIKGDFKTIFLSSEIQNILGIQENSMNLEKWMNHNIIFYFENLFSKISSSLENELLFLILSITSIHTFIQIHFTGPKPMFDSSILFPTHWKTTLNLSNLEKNVLKCLQVDKTYPYHLIQHPSFLLVSKLALSKPFKYSKTYLWWKARIDFIHQRLLDEPVVTLYNCIFKNLKEIAKECEKQDYYIRACYALELGICLNYYGQNFKGFESIQKAAKETGLQWILTGVLGRRTKFQIFDTSQLVLIAKGDNTFEKTKENQKIPKTLDLNDDTLLETISFKPGEIISQSNQETNIPESLKNINPNDQQPLTPLDSCILLALTLFIKNTNPNDGLTVEEIAPYTERVLKHPKNWSVHSMALLVRCRLEADKRRTMERREKAIDIKILEILVEEIIKNQYTGEEKGFLKYAIDLVVNIIPPLITSDPLLWKIVAKINIWRNKPSDALEAYIKSYHIWISKGNIDTNKDIWIGAVDSAMELVDAYKKFGSLKDCSGNLIVPDWKFKARSVLQSLKGKGQLCWSDSEEFDTINQCLKELKSNES